MAAGDFADILLSVSGCITKLFIEVTIINFVLGVVLCLVVTNAVWVLVFESERKWFICTILPGISLA